MKVGDVIEVKDASKEMALVLEAQALAERDVPDYIEVDHGKMTAKLARVPALTRCPIRCRWSRIWSSSSIRADRLGFTRYKRPPSGRPFCFGMIGAISINRARQAR